MNDDQLDKLEVRAEAAPWWNGVAFLLMQGNAYGAEVIMRKRTPADEGMRIGPTFHLSIEKAQLLMDDLWASGLRPTEGYGSAGAFAAVQYHLEDMRALVFKK